MNTCGSGLAREGVSPDNIDVECTGPFASKPAPTGLCVGVEIQVSLEVIGGFQ
jgi:hypothetical protein